MPWKDGYTHSDERSIPDGEIVWPQGKRSSFTITVSLDPQCSPSGLAPDDPRSPAAYYGMHRALDAVRSLLTRYRLRATFVVSAALAAIYPDVIRSIADAGHEIAAHGYRREDVISGLDPDTERERLQRTTKILEKVSGSRPMGWYAMPRRSDKYAVGTISPNTMALLRDSGYTYMGNSTVDDIPHYWVTDAADPQAPEAILAMPYYYHYDDQFFLLFPTKGTGLEHADSLICNWSVQLDAQHKRGRSFVMFIHPYAITWAHRLKMLDEFLGYASGLEGLWNATALQCAEHWATRYPAATTLRLKPSIWANYQDSLS